MATIYVRNLDEKTALTTLKEELKQRFSEFGEIIGISAKKSLKMRGQAFIDFKDSEEAAKAISSLNDTELFGKKIIVQQAKRDSDAVHLLKTGAPRKRKLDTGDHGPSKQKKQKTVANKILFLQNLPKSVTVEQLDTRYKPYAGFVEARAFAVKGVGFIEFDTIDNASKALGNFELDENIVDVGYAK